MQELKMGKKTTDDAPGGGKSLAACTWDELTSMKEDD